MIIAKQLIEKVDGFVGHKMLVLRCDKTRPWLARVASKNYIVMRVQLNFVLVQICLLYTSDAADDMQCVDLGGRRIIKKKFFEAEDGIRDSP